MQRTVGIKISAVLITVASLMYIPSWISNWEDLVAHTSLWGRYLSFSVLAASLMLCLSAPGLFFLKEKSRILALISSFILLVPFLAVIFFPLIRHLLSGHWHGVVFILLSGLIYAGICYLSPILILYLCLPGTKRLFKEKT